MMPSFSLLLHFSNFLPVSQWRKKMRYSVLFDKNKCKERLRERNVYLYQRQHQREQQEEQEQEELSLSLFIWWWWLLLMMMMMMMRRGGEREEREMTERKSRKKVSTFENKWRKKNASWVSIQALCCGIDEKEQTKKTGFFTAKSVKSVNKAVGLFDSWYFRIPNHLFPFVQLTSLQTLQKTRKTTYSLQNKKHICWPTKRRRVCKKKHRVNNNTFSSAAAPLLKSSYKYPRKTQDPTP